MEKALSYLASGGRWMSGQFSNWFARSLVMAGWFLVIMTAIYVDFTMGGEYMERWSPKDELDFRFRLLGYAMAGAPIVTMAAGFRARRLEAKSVGNFLIGFACVLSVFSIAQSIGTMSLTAENMAREAEAFEKVEETDDDLIGELEKQRDALNLLIANREGALNSEIQNLDNDGKLNEELTETMRSQRVSLQADQDAELKRINARILCLKGDETQCLEEEKVGEDLPVIAPLKFDPMVIVINWFTSWGQPNDLEKRWITLIYLTAIGIVICFIGQTLTPFLILTARHASQALEKDPVRVAAGKKAAKTRKENDGSRDQQRRLKVQNQLSSYIPAFRKAKANKLKRPKYVPQATAEYYFDMSSAERMDEVLKQMVRADLISKQDHDLLMDRRLPVVADNANGIDTIDRPVSNLNGEADVQSDDERNTA